MRPNHIQLDDTEEYEAMDWRHRALCRDEDPELFFPIGTTGPAVVQIEQAKAVCRRCPVTQSCLEWALSSGQDSGVWGGLSVDERRALRRRTARTGVGTAFTVSRGPVFEALRRLRASLWTGPVQQ